MKMLPSLRLAALYGAFGLSLSGCFGGCGPSTPEGRDLEAGFACLDEAAPAGPTVILGTAEEGAFEPLTGGEDLVLDYGPQGGQHFYFSGRFFGAGPSDFVVARFEGDDAINSGSSSSFLDVQCSDGQWIEADNARLVMDSAAGGGGRLTVELGHCSGAGGGCSYDPETGEPLDFEVTASVTVELTVLP